MIDSTDYTVQTGVYLHNGRLWRILGYCPEPSVSMVSISSGEIEHFGLGGLTNKAYTRLKSLKYDHTTSEIRIVK